MNLDFIGVCNCSFLQDFESILLPEVDEQHLVAHVEPVTCDPTIKRWKAVLLEEKGSIFWENLYLSDQLNRVLNEQEKPVRKKEKTAVLEIQRQTWWEKLTLEESFVHWKRQC